MWMSQAAVQYCGTLSSTPHSTRSLMCSPVLAKKIRLQSSRLMLARLPPLLLPLLCQRSQARVLEVRFRQRGPVSSPLWRRRSLTSTLYCILVAFVEKFAFEDEEWDCWLVSTSTVAVRTEVARIGYRATRDVRRTTEEQALREALHFRPRRGRRRLKLNVSLRHDTTSLCS